MENKTHYRKAFDSPYLSSADIVEPTVFTVSCTKLELDKTKKTKDSFNTGYFAEKEIRPGEALKPMIFNAVNSKTMKKLTGSPFIDDWNNVKITVYVDHNVRFGRETVDGLRVSKDQPAGKKELLPETTAWTRAIEVYQKTGSLESVEKHVIVSEENKAEIIRLSALGEK